MDPTIKKGIINKGNFERVKVHEEPVVHCPLLGHLHFISNCNKCDYRGDDVVYHGTLEKGDTEQTDFIFCLYKFRGLERLD